MTNGKTRTCGLIGNPVEHTLSPVIHNTLAENFEHNLVYVPFRVDAEYVEEAVKGAYALNILGCNVTVPYKSAVIPFLKDIDPMAEKIGAVNTLVRIEGGFKGYNTDLPGLYRAMVSDDVKIKGEQILILGAGGVARAAAMLMADKGAKRIVIVNRTVEKAQILAGEIQKFYPEVLFEAAGLNELSRFNEKKTYLAIQATNIGMYPNCEETLIDNPEFYEAVHTGYDMIFNPADTRFMQLVRASGGRAYNGLKMLLYQGVIAYELWNRVQVEDAQAEQIYEKMKQNG